MPKPTKRGRRGARTTETTETEEADPVVGGEPVTDVAAEEAPTLGQAIDWVRQALTPFDGDTRRRIIRAANQLIK
jgi:hypothetical protein